MVTAALLTAHGVAAAMAGDGQVTGGQALQTQGGTLMVGTHHQWLSLSEDDLTLADVSAGHHIAPNMVIILDTVGMALLGVWVAMQCPMLRTTILSGTLATGEAGIMTTDEAPSSLSTLISTHCVSLSHDELTDSDLIMRA